MKTFTNKDIVDYYDQTETHYNLFWKLEESMGIHYGVWADETKSIAEAVVNGNRSLAQFGNIKSSDLILDAGCGIGGSAIFLAKNIGCQVKGITLSEKQVETAKRLAKNNNVDHLVEFKVMDYTKTNFSDSTFDVIWAVESFGSAHEKASFLQEMKRILKPGGKILFTDTFKPTTYSIQDNKDMQTMLNGWAISDILSIEELQNLGEENGFTTLQVKDISKKIVKSVQRYYYAAYFGMIGTKLYNIFKNASPFSKIHYKTGFAQKRSFDKKDWQYYHIELQKK